MGYLHDCPNRANKFDCGWRSNMFDVRGGQEAGLSLTRIVGLASAGSNSTVGWSATTYSDVIWYNSADHSLVFPNRKLSHVEVESFSFEGNWTDTSFGVSGNPEVYFSLCWVNSAGSIVQTNAFFFAELEENLVAGAISKCGVTLASEATIPATACGVKLKTEAYNANGVNTALVEWDVSFAATLRAA